MHFKADLQTRQCSATGLCTTGCCSQGNPVLWGAVAMESLHGEQPKVELRAGGAGLVAHGSGHCPPKEGNPTPGGPGRDVPTPLPILPSLQGFLERSGGAQRPGDGGAGRSGRGRATGGDGALTGLPASRRLAAAIAVRLLGRPRRLLAVGRPHGRRARRVGSACGGCRGSGRVLLGRAALGRRLHIAILWLCCGQAQP